MWGTETNIKGPKGDKGDKGDPGAAVGISQAEADLRYVNISGDTMTGVLLMAPAAGNARFVMNAPAARSFSVGSTTGSEFWVVDETLGLARLRINAAGTVTASIGLNVNGPVNAGVVAVDNAMNFYTGTLGFRIGRHASMFSEFYHDAANARWMSTTASKGLALGTTDAAAPITFMTADTPRAVLTDTYFNVAMTTPSTSSSTGALVVPGGVGIGGKLMSAGAAFFTGTITTAPTTTSGTLFFGLENGNRKLEYDGTKYQFTNAPLNLNHVLASTSATTGALTVAGGVGVGEKVYVGPGGTSTDKAQLFLDGGTAVGGGGNIAFRRNGLNSWNVGHITVTSGGGTSDLSFYSWDATLHALRIAATTGAVGLGCTSPSTSSTTGALVVPGGVGIGGALSVGNNTTTTIREVLVATKTYYVNAGTGSDSNTGLASGTAFATLQKAMDVIAMTLDCNIYNVQVSVANGTYAPLVLKSYIGTANVTFTGNTGTPASCLITGSTPPISTVASGGNFIFGGFKLVATGSASDFRATGSTKITLSNMDVGGATAAFRVWIDQFAQIIWTGTNTVSGGGTVSLGLFLVEMHGYLYINSATFTFSAATTYGVTMTCRNLGLVSANSSTTFSGSAVTGTRYTVALNGVIATFGATQIAGSVAGTAVTGGQYA